MRQAGGEEPSSDPAVRARRILRATELEVEALGQEIAARRGAGQDTARRARPAPRDVAGQADHLEELVGEAARLADAALAGVHELCTAVDVVVRALREGSVEDAEATADGPATAEPERVGSPARPDPPTAPRFVAIEMAVGGATREQVDRHLRGQFGLADTGTVLDGVFGRETAGTARLASGR